MVARLENHRVTEFHRDAQRAEKMRKKFNHRGRRFLVLAAAFEEEGEGGGGEEGEGGGFGGGGGLIVKDEIDGDGLPQGVGWLYPFAFV